MSENIVHAPSPFSLENAKSIAMKLTTTQRKYVKSGALHGDFAMTTLRSLKRKGLFELVIDSPNGRCGFMRLTPLGDAVRAALAAADGEQASISTTQLGAKGHP